MLPERQSGQWLVGTPERHLFIEDPITFEERLAVAKRCAEEMALDYPMLVDELEDRVNITYAAWPERLYVMDLDGSIVYRGGQGPADFDPDELETVLERCSPAWERGVAAGEAGRLPEKPRLRDRVRKR